MMQIVLQFSPEETPGHVYTVVLDTLEKKVDATIALNAKDKLREMEVVLADLIARVKNATQPYRDIPLRKDLD